MGDRGPASSVRVCLIGVLGASYGSRGERITRQAALPRGTKHCDDQLPDNQPRLAAALCDGHWSAEGIAQPVPGGHVGQTPM